VRAIFPFGRGAAQPASANGNAKRPVAYEDDAELVARATARLVPARPPGISVVIPVFGKWSVTRRCLESLLVCDVDLPIQVIVVDDASPDDSTARAAAIPGIDVVRNAVNAGFVDSCNRGALLARGEYILFLNNDTELHPGALSALGGRVQTDPKIGIVGSKLVYPDGRLQEAGGIVWSDAGGWNYGRYDSPRRPEYNFVRDVDYVSGASLLVRSSLFRAIGGFDVRYAPGYYEDADLCFEARARGFRVVYEPESVVTHHEGVSSGTDTERGMKRFQALNRPKFFMKWSAVLGAEHLASDPANVRRAARARGRPARGILIVDTYVPFYDREAGSKRLRELIDGFVAAGERIVYLPDNLAAIEPYSRELQQMGVELLYYSEGDPRRWKELLLDALPTVDVAWICRPELCRKYLPAIRQHSAIPVLYDTIDLHHLRLRRQAELEGSDAVESQRLETLELTCARAADGTVVVTESEAAVLRAAGIETVAVVPTIHDVAQCPRRPFESTAGIIFIGGYNHTPNVDAVQWLIADIMPLVWARIPDVQVTLLGAHPPPAVLELAGPRVAVPGYVREVEPYFIGARIFVAPLRYGAGIKGKVGQALAYRVPTVTTPVGAEGFGLTDGRDVLIAEGARAFASAIVSLYGDADLWTRIASRCAEPLEAFSRERVVAQALDLIERVGARRPGAVST
jgi:O-antigen biosynthesis protein